MSFLPFGYPDGARVTQQDASLAAWNISGTFNGVQHSGSLATQGFSDLLLFADLAAGGMLFQISHTLDGNLANLLGFEQLVVDSAINCRWSTSRPLLSPFVQVDAFVLTGQVNFQGTITAFLTNKSRPMTPLPKQQIWAGSSTSIPASGNRTENAPFYCAGPANVYTQGGSQQTQFQLQAEDNSGTWRILYLVSNAGLVSANQPNIILPLAPLRMLITNSSGAGADAAWNFTVAPDLTGV